MYSGLCLLVPVPFLDDVLAERTRRHMVSQLLALHGRAASPAHLQPLYTDPSRGCFIGCLSAPFWIVRKLLLIPIKKILKTVFFFLGVRDAALEIARTYLLGRTIARQLAAGQLNRPEEAADVRARFDLAFAGIDRRFLMAAVQQLFRSVRSLPAAVKAVRDLWAKEDSELPASPDTLPADERSALASLVDQLQSALATDDVKRLLEDFDRRFDAAVAPKSGV